MQALYELLGHPLCFWDIPFFVLLLAMAVVALIHGINQKKREDQFEEEQRDADKNAEEVKASSAQEA